MGNKKFEWEWTRKSARINQHEQQFFEFKLAQISAQIIEKHLTEEDESQKLIVKCGMEIKQILALYKIVSIFDRVRANFVLGHRNTVGGRIKHRLCSQLPSVSLQPISIRFRSVDRRNLCNQLLKFANWMCSFVTFFSVPAECLKIVTEGRTNVVVWL